MREFVVIDPTIMTRVIYYSILHRDIKISLLQLRMTKLAIRNLRTTIPSFNDLNDVEIELMHRSDEIQQSCRLLLEPLFEGIDFGHKYFNHWTIPIRDIRQGYCELEEIKQFKDRRPLIFGRKYILLLYDYTDSSLGIYKAGRLIELSHAIHFIDSIPPRKDKVKGIYDAIVANFELASRYRTSNIMPNE
jgi:hypothetical protein